MNVNKFPRAHLKTIVMNTSVFLYGLHLQRLFLFLKNMMTAVI